MVRVIASKKLSKNKDEKESSRHRIRADDFKKLSTIQEIVKEKLELFSQRSKEQFHVWRLFSVLEQSRENLTAD
jgi:acetyl-CoA carboxylase alpha subunit